jgi:uncharacterized membrane protein SpoIIM required for sporulation
MKATWLGLAVAVVLAAALSWWLDLSPKGIAAITAILIIVCLGIGQLLRLLFGSTSQDENKKNSDS